MIFLSLPFLFSHKNIAHVVYQTATVLPAKSDSDVMFCLHSFVGLRIDSSRVY